MGSKWIIFAVGVWVIGMILGASYDKVNIGTYAPTGAVNGTNVTTTSALSFLLNFGKEDYQSSVTGVWSYAKASPNYFTILWRVMTFDFGFMQGTGYQILRLIVFLPIGVSIAFGIWEILVNLMQGLISALIP
jgi:ABC-type microcin C transport system permease subunit YejB